MEVSNTKNKYGLSYIKSATYIELMRLVNKEDEMISDSLWSHVETVNVCDVNTTRVARGNTEVSNISKFFAR